MRTIILFLLTVAPALLAQDSLIKRFSLTYIPGKQVSADVDFTKLVTTTPEKSTVELRTFPASNIEVTAVNARPGRADSLEITYKGDPGQATLALVCFKNVTLGDLGASQNVCAQGPVIKAANLEEQARGVLVGIVRNASPMAKRNIRVTQTIIDPRTVADAYGSRIARRFVALQVTVANSNQNYEFLVHDVSLRFPFSIKEQTDASTSNRTNAKEITVASEGGIVDCATGQPNGKNDCIELSSLDLSILQGVAEKGQYKDTRNLVLRALQFAGTVAGGIQGVTHFGISFAPAVAAFNGPLISAYKDLFPDYTVNQLNRLNNRAYRVNTVVANGQSGLAVIFVPRAILMSQEESNLYDKDLHSLLTGSILSGIAVLVDGMFITAADLLAPSMNNVTFTPDAKAAQSDKPELKGFVLGSALADTTIELGSGAPKDSTIKIDGTPSDNRLDFILNATAPIPPDTSIQIVLKKGTTSSKLAGVVSYTAGGLTASFDPSSGKPSDTPVNITMTGTGFYSTTKVTPPGPGFTITDLQSDDKTPSTKMTFKLKIDKNATSGAFQVVSESRTKAVQFSVTK